jgi:T-complex protein 1 subunit beta
VVDANFCVLFIYFRLQMLPVQILKENASDERGETARLSSFVGAIAIGDLVKSTLGPKGMVRIYQFST